MSPRTRLLVPAAGLLLLSACGAPPEPLPTSPPLPRAGGSVPAGSAPVGSAPPGGPVPPSIYSPPPMATPTYSYPTYRYPTPTPPD
ncbi:hypothetical protein [Actinoplanes sp. CA-252034]|uniref:hypothetical protein n=1 Tax=Actinoplanes sp. CA-252034 TaxID=3239906 RepID=UPI003D9800B9